VFGIGTDSPRGGQSLAMFLSEDPWHELRSMDD
jgi:hypothetical protein